MFLLCELKCVGMFIVGEKLLCRGRGVEILRLISGIILFDKKLEKLILVVILKLLSEIVVLVLFLVFVLVLLLKKFIIILSCKFEFEVKWEVDIKFLWLIKKEFLKWSCRFEFEIKIDNNNNMVLLRRKSEVFVFEGCGVLLNFKILYVFCWLWFCLVV